MGDTGRSPSEQGRYQRTQAAGMREALDRAEARAEQAERERVWWETIALAWNETAEALKVAGEEMRYDLLTVDNGRARLSVMRWQEIGWREVSAGGGALPVVSGSLPEALGQTSPCLEQADPPAECICGEINARNCALVTLDEMREKM